MTIHLGDVPASSTLYIPFDSYSSTGASITLTGLAVTDIEIYKNGSVTQRSSDAGYTLLDTDGIDFDGITGIHGFSINLSDNTDAGFYVAGSFYWVVISAVTIDTQTINFVAATFRICAAETISGTPKSDVAAWLGTAAAATSIAGVPEVDVTHWLGTAVASPSVNGVPEVDVTHFNGSAGTFASGRPEVNTSHAAGTAWASGAITSGVFASGAITATAIATDAIGAAELADGAITAATFAAGAIDATAVATGAIDADALAADAGTELGTAVWATGTRTLSAGAVTTATFAAGAIDAAAIAADAIGASELAADAATEIGTAVWATTPRSLTLLDEDSTTLDLDATIRSAVGLASANLDTQLDALPTAPEAFTAVLTTQLTQSYAADGAAPTLAQAIFMIQQMLGDFAITGTTLTVKQLNGTSTAATFTLDSATTPTSITRAT